MAAKSLNPAPVQHLKYERFTTKQHGYQLWYLSLSLCGHIAVSGLNNNSKRTFLDLYSAGSEHKLKIVYSKEFEKYSNYKYRYVSFLDKTGSKLVTCIGDKLEVIDTKNESKEARCCIVNGETRCLAVREEEIFIGLYESQTVVIYTNDLKVKKKIILQGIQDGDWPWDLQVIRNTIFVCTGVFNNALSLGVCDGSIVSKCTDSSAMYGNARSLAVSEKLSLLTVVWGWRRIIVYSLNENKSLLIFDVDSKVHTIRLSDRDRMIITGNYYTGEIKMYNLEHLFSFEGMKRTLAYLVSFDESEKLRKYFRVTEEEIGRLEAGDENESKHFSENERKIKKMECLLGVIEEKGYLGHNNVNNLIDAVSTFDNQIRSSSLMGPMEGYSLHGKNMKIPITGNITLQKSSDDEKNQLRKKLEIAERKLKSSVKEEFSIDKEDIRKESISILAVEFGRLTVAIAEKLTLDHCLKLARICKLRMSDCHTVRRLSFMDSPGMKFLYVLTKRGVINMFDVTNIQKALAMLHLETVNRELVVPYQDKIDKEQYVQYKAEELYTWEEVDAFVNAVNDDSTRQKIRNTSQPYSTEQQLEEGEDSKRSLLREIHHHHQLYVECHIGREGGIIQLANVSLIVPSDALKESHVMALSIMNESPFPLDREVDTARMTPIIKLEPLGLKVKKSLQLNIHHSALITEPENHDVIIFSGQTTKNKEKSLDSVTWTEEKSIPRHLKEKSVTVDIQCLTYISASLVSGTAVPPLFIVRAVPFVDGIRNTDDDVILTICFCCDNAPVYNMLLSDYQTKLPMDQYTTIQLRRYAETDQDDAGFLRVTVSSINNTYVPYNDQETKRFAVSHLFTASRVSHQLRLQKNQGAGLDVFHVGLTFSQAGTTLTTLFMKARTKDLIMSQESKDILTNSLFTAFRPYEDLKANISSMLENDHCIKLATFFELSPAEAERVKTDEAPGRILMKILDEREKIMPRKMFGLYQGLKVCHLDKLARTVLEYIVKNSNETQQEGDKSDKDKFINGISDDTSVLKRPLQQRQTRRSRTDKSVQTEVTTTCLSSDSLVKILHNKLNLGKDKTSDTSSVIYHPLTPLKWIIWHPGIIRYFLLMFADGVVQTQRGVFTLPRWIKS